MHSLSALPQCTQLAELPQCVQLSGWNGCRFVPSSDKAHSSTDVCTAATLLLSRCASVWLCACNAAVSLCLSPAVCLYCCCLAVPFSGCLSAMPLSARKRDRAGTHSGLPGGLRRTAQRDSGIQWVSDRRRKCDERTEHCLAKYCFPCDHSCRCPRTAPHSDIDVHRGTVTHRATQSHTQRRTLPGRGSQTAAF